MSAPEPATDRAAGAAPMPAPRGGPLVAAGLTAGVAVAFVVWSWLTATGRLFGIDDAVGRAVAVAPTAPLHGAVRWLGVAGGVEASAVVVGALLVAAWVRPELRRLVALMGVALVLGAALEYLMKTHLDHPPPPATGQTDVSVFLLATPFSYPSGHTFRVLCIALAATLAARAGSTRVARGVAVAATVVAVAVVYSRLALSAHWLTDVVGGLLLALAVVPWLLLATPRSGLRAS